jgi:hypothetical protein
MCVGSGTSAEKLGGEFGQRLDLRAQALGRAIVPRELHDPAVVDLVRVDGPPVPIGPNVARVELGEARSPSGPVDVVGLIRSDRCPAASPEPRRRPRRVAARGSAACSARTRRRPPRSAASADAEPYSTGAPRSLIDEPADARADDRRDPEPDHRRDRVPVEYRLAAAAVR